MISKIVYLVMGFEGYEIKVNASDEAIEEIINETHSAYGGTNLRLDIKGLGLMRYRNRSVVSDIHTDGSTTLKYYLRLTLIESEMSRQYTRRRLPLLLTTTD